MLPIKGITPNFNAINKIDKIKLWKSKSKLLIEYLQYLHAHPKNNNLYNPTAGFTQQVYSNRVPICRIFFESDHPNKVSLSLRSMILRGSRGMLVPFPLSSSSQLFSLG